MIEIYECTDCRFCASFVWGYRVVCLNPELPPGEVEKYAPVGDRSAERCKKFAEGGPKHFSLNDFGFAEAYSITLSGEVDYLGIRAWCEKKLAERKAKAKAKGWDKLGEV